MNKLAAKRLSALALLLYTGALVTGTHLPPSELPAVPTNDKLLHFGAYFGLAFLSGAWLSTQGIWRTRTAFLCALSLAVFGAVDELTQPFFRRTAEWADWGADLLGIVSGLIAWGIAHALLRSLVTALQPQSEIKTQP